MMPLDLTLSSDLPSGQSMGDFPALMQAYSKLNFSRQGRSIARHIQMLTAI